MLEIKHLTKVYQSGNGKVIAIDDVTLTFGILDLSLSPEKAVQANRRF